MNKVVSIEIAKQVFWIEEQAYEELQSYSQTIKNQLVNEEFSDDIFQDIELRIAELLYNLGGTDKKAIGSSQLQQVIEQVGFMDSDEVDQDLPRRSYLDPQNKIVGGVCAGLSVRWGVSVFLLRLVFIALGFLFGLGIVLYFIFWFSLDKNNSRNAALSAHGEVPTAKKIADVKPIKVNPLLKLQRIIFLPFSIIGVLVTVVAEHFKTRNKVYLSLFKGLFTIALIFGTFTFLILIYQLNHVQLFPWPMAWLITLAVMFLLVLGWVKYIRKYYLTSSQKLLDIRLKSGALFSGLVVITASVYFIFATYDYQQEKVSKSFKLAGNQLKLNFNEQRPHDSYYRSVDFQIKTTDTLSDKVVVHFNYSSEGRNDKVAKKNIETIQYFFTFADDTLELDSFWRLKKSALNRSQDLEIQIEVPQNIIISSNRLMIVDSRLMTVNNRLKPVKYVVRVKDKYQLTLPNKYKTSQYYIHEAEPDEISKISKNEKIILDDKFCKEFFISENWACKNNINTLVSENKRFDRAFVKDIKIINQIREILLPNRTLFVSNIEEIRGLVNSLSIQDKGYIQQSEFNQYIQHLLKVKSKLNKDFAPTD